MIENVLEKTTNPAEKCQALMARGTKQCMYKVVEGSTRCILHGGHHASKRIEAAKVRNYNLQSYQRRVEEFSNSEGVKSLREEIGIVRLTLENILNKCKDDNDLLMYSTKIAMLAEKIQNLVIACHKLESSLGFMMDKSTVLNISQELINIVAIHVDDPKMLDEITNSVVELIGAT